MNRRIHLATPTRNGRAGTAPLLKTLKTRRDEKRGKLARGSTHSPHILLVQRGWLLKVKPC